MLANNFKKYFLADDKLIANYDWVKNPFHTTPEGEKFIDFTTSGETKRQFSNKSLLEFWAEVEDEFSALKTRAIPIILPFSTSYLC